ncbi:MAG: hypothetical protein WA021_00645 [Minisyncoccia bacterium]
MNTYTVSGISKGVLVVALSLFAIVMVAMPQGMANAEGIGGEEWAIDWDTLSNENNFGGGGDIEWGNTGTNNVGDIEWYGNEGTNTNDPDNDYDGDGDDDYDYGCDDDCYDYENEGCNGCGGSYGGGYSIGGTSYKPTYTTPGCTNCGGTTYKPTPVTGGGSQSQTQTSNNTNTNVNVNNNTAIAVVQIGGQTASYPNYPTTPSQPAPYCTIYQAQYGSYYSGGARPVYLSWNSSNAQHAYLSNYGSVSVNGSQTVYPTYATTYTLTVYGYNGQQASCQTTVYGNTAIPTTPYVSLTQIPYTGFDLGPIGNAMYWVGLAVFAMGAAYLATYYVPQLLTAQAGAFAGIRTRAYAPVVAPKAPLLLEKEAQAANVAPIVASLRKAGTVDSMAIVQVKGSMPKIVVDRS